jgi:hypothetical protein
MLSFPTDVTKAKTNINENDFKVKGATYLHKLISNHLLFERKICNILDFLHDLGISPTDSDIRHFFLSLPPCLSGPNLLNDLLKQK